MSITQLGIGIFRVHGGQSHSEISATNRLSQILIG